MDCLVRRLRAGQCNWPKMSAAIAKIQAARAAGVPITANMYTYTAAATGLDATMPAWVQEGGIDAWVERLQDPLVRKRVVAEMRESTIGGESLYLAAAGSPDRVLLLGFKSAGLKSLTGKTLAEVSMLRGKSPEDTAIDLVIEDRTRVGAAYYLMAEDNVRLGLSQSWVSIDSDEGALAPEGLFLKSSNHPRAYGGFARFLGKYVREEKVAPLSEAIRRMTRLPAQNWKLRNRGCLERDCYADIVIFDPDHIADHATFTQPRLFATGVVDVFVNGVQVLKDGEHTGAEPGEVVRGPGWTGWQDHSARHEGPAGGILSASRVLLRQTLTRSVGQETIK